MTAGCQKVFKWEICLESFRISYLESDVTDHVPYKPKIRLQLTIKGEVFNFDRFIQYFAIGKNLFFNLWLENLF